MSNLFYIGDIHFGHEKCYSTFTRPDGSLLRNDLASNTDEGDELLIERWNAVVRPNDTVVIVGDITINHKHLHKLSRLVGRKQLVLGNHDTASIETYMQYFVKIHALMEKDGCVITHIPVHTSQVDHRWKLNIHGHLHHNVIRDRFGMLDARYLCVSVEQTNYVPISHEDVKFLARERGNSAL